MADVTESAGENGVEYSSALHACPEGLTLQDARTHSSIPTSDMYELHDLDFDVFTRNVGWRASSRDDGRVNHGFSFGESSFSVGTDDHGADSDHKKEEDDEEEEDARISQAYVTEANAHTPAPSPNFRGRRQVLSHRIASVGSMGHNLALGHITGVLVEDSELKPGAVLPDTLTIALGEDSPLQTDLNWEKPANVHRLTGVSYDVEAKAPDGENDWQLITSVRQPVFRIYHTEETLFLGKCRIARQETDVTVCLRVRARGELSHQGQPSGHMLLGDWSQDIRVIFVGTRPTHNVDVHISEVLDITKL
ncbi:uncharacterized protein LOC106011528 [Aplysia californica]|uniref:Uncharacterized protein LOC106011528 n=1 Tax=Aplysia californica TaxID=6500 RepID=A0ABM0ZYA1_APLCA|nr:uncharacterized protein LOC106011528 [Aplysia californica]